MVEPRRGAAIAGGALLLVAGTVAVAQAVSQSWRPDGVPSFDAADYLEQALSYRDAFAARDGRTVVELALAPNVHPPLHALALGAALTATGGGLAAACGVELAVFVASLAVLVWLGHRLDPVHGRFAGAAAAVLVASSDLHQRLAAAPMTENLALLTALVAVGLVARGASFAGGVALLAASLVRYNLLPMLLLPAVAWAAIEGERRRAVGWIVVPLLAFASWRAARPGLDDALATFFLNVDSGVPTWSAENLLWLPRTVAAQGYGVVGAVLLAWGFAAGLVAAWAERWRGGRDAGGLRLVQLVALAGVAALTLHPFKLDRAVHGTVAFLVLGATLGVARLLRGRARPVAMGALLVACAGLWLRNAAPATPGRLEVADSREVRAVLDELVARTRARPRLLFVGSHPSLSVHTLALWHHLAGTGVDVVREANPDPACGAEEVPEGVDCTPEEVARTLADPVARARTTVIVVVRPEATRRQREGGRRTSRWAQETARRVEALAGAQGLLPEARSYPRVNAEVWIY